MNQASTLDTTELSPHRADGVVELLQITDTHLFADKDTDLLGIASWHSCQAVVDAILEDQKPRDMVLATGDLSQDHSAGSYRRFAELMSRLAPPVFWLPGNHDDAPVMQAELDQAGISDTKHLLCGQWQILLLDTQIPGATHGELSASQLALLEQAIAGYPDHHLLVAVHHQAVPVGCAWLDQHNLRNADAFRAILARHRAQRVVLFGHVHQGFDQVHDGVRYLASPSTCIQFKPLSDDFALEHTSPGWRALSLYPDGRLSTQVWRLPPDTFVPDFSAKGY
ncbi:3',5'-cyclic-AMP phosphodiesterase [Oceanisphaera psychrotolerans]|uniref:3',5'-cyclic adenosine monophosphate phosphodiesterase CpdA n=1 Tax=Oceanisphaera psychrotolerans TaxID=1414654 RepID=A0A1J4QEV9_9GAMM|nr:3',5'-cyclic-AMP phosphodiesterase [Oceanisphaera psychrotolerans]OIN08843.1 3',5'-cyclic-AMP phosphodiesterase [Oceanisphaera psychrotolerans]